MPTVRSATDGKLRAPFTRDEVWSLNAYQDAGVMHPYTCPTCREQAPRIGDERLVATTFGWVCRNRNLYGCHYVQYWAHDWTANWRWKRDWKGFI